MYGMEGQRKKRMVILGLKLREGISNVPWSNLRGSGARSWERIMCAIVRNELDRRTAQATSSKNVPFGGSARENGNWRFVSEAKWAFGEVPQKEMDAG